MVIMSYENAIWCVVPGCTGVEEAELVGWWPAATTPAGPSSCAACKSLEIDILADLLAVHVLSWSETGDELLFA